MNIDIAETLAESLTIKYRLDRPEFYRWPDTETGRKLFSIKRLGNYISELEKQYNNTELRIGQVRARLKDEIASLYSDTDAREIKLKDLHERLSREHQFNPSDTIREEIRAMLAQDNTGYDCSPDNHEDTFSYKVYNVVLKEFNGEKGDEPELPLGDFVIWFSLKNLKMSMDNKSDILTHIRVTPCGNNTAWNSFYHPHVDQAGRVCFGEAADAAKKAFGEFRFLDGFRLIESILRTYNIKSPYPANFPVLYKQWQIKNKLNRIEDETCQCGEQAQMICKSCLRPVCTSCAKMCATCGYESCVECTDFTSCDVCGDSICDECSTESRCTVCGDVLCATCKGRCYVCDCCGDTICETCVNDAEISSCFECGRMYCVDCVDSEEIETVLDPQGRAFCSQCTALSEHTCEVCGAFKYQGVCNCEECGTLCCDECLCITEGDMRNLCKDCYDARERERNESEQNENESEASNETQS